MNFYYILSSITFLQLYIPIAKYAHDNHGITSIFIKTKNIKEYACPYAKANRPSLSKAISDKPYIAVVESSMTILHKKGIFFVVDGDIYGRRKQFVTASHLRSLNKESYVISLQEHMNFVWAYDKFINNVSLCVFPNEHLARYYNKLSSKNVYLGNTKYDDILDDKSMIYKKYELDATKRYCLFLYPREIFMKNLNIPFSKVKFLLEVIRTNLKLDPIVKYRPKDTDGKDLSYYKCVISDCYPNESIELMNVSELCVMFSSSCIDECIITKTPCIDCIIDYEDCNKMEYLIHKQTLQKIPQWENKSANDIINVYNKLAKPNDDIFESLKHKYLFDLNTSAERIVEHIMPNIFL